MGDPPHTPSPSLAPKFSRPDNVPPVRSGGGGRGPGVDGEDAVGGDADLAVGDEVGGPVPEPRVEGVVGPEGLPHRPEGRNLELLGLPQDH